MCMALVFLAVCYKGYVSLLVDFLSMYHVECAPKNGLGPTQRPKRSEGMDAFKNGITGDHGQIHPLTGRRTDPTHTFLSDAGQSRLRGEHV